MLILLGNKAALNLPSCDVYPRKFVKICTGVVEASMLSAYRQLIENFTFTLNAKNSLGQGNIGLEESSHRISSTGTPPNQDLFRPGFLPNWTSPIEVLQKQESSREVL